MQREEIKNKIINYLKQQFQSSDCVQMMSLYTLFDDVLQENLVYTREKIYTIIREIVQEFINNGFLYAGNAGDPGSTFPWLTVTEYGKEAFIQEKENWLPYDPEGYIKALKEKVQEIDDVTLIYISESIASFNRRQLLSATLTLGVASENLMLLLIESYVDSIKNPEKKIAFEKKIKNRPIYTQYKEFKLEFTKDIKNLPKKLQTNWEIYLEGIFNFIRLHRNNAGHPTGIQINAKIIYANLQIFADYARYIFNLIKHLSPIP